MLSVMYVLVEFECYAACDAIQDFIIVNCVEATANDAINLLIYATSDAIVLIICTEHTPHANDFRN